MTQNTSCMAVSRLIAMSAQPPHADRAGSDLAPGDPVNLEADLFGKYVERMQAEAQGRGPADGSRDGSRLTGRARRRSSTCWR